MRLLSTGLALIILFFTQAQSSEFFFVNGLIASESTQQPIPYANIGILDTEIGTLSDEDGSFSIKIPTVYKDQYLLFSSIGYERKSIALSEITTASSLQVELKETVTILEEVAITSEKFKKQKEVFGNGKSLLLNGILKGDSVNAGAAIALLIDKNKYPDLAYAHRASLYIAKNRMPSFKIRMRILAVDSLNMLKPGEDLIPWQIIEESSIEKGWLEFPILPSILIENEAFYLTFEWILTRKERRQIDDLYDQFYELYPEKISYDTTIIDGEEIITRVIPKAIAGTYFGVTDSKKDRTNFVCYARGHSFGEWERMSSILSAKIELANYPLDTSRAIAFSPVLSITDSINSWARTFKEEHNIPGFQLAIMKGDQLIHSNAYGYLDKQEKIKVNPKTQFRIASISKPITSAGVMRLVGDGKLDLEKPIQHYVPSFPKKEYPITIRQLLGHLGGLRDYYGISWEKELFLQEHYNNATEALSIFRDDSLVAKPGTQFIYSPFGYMLLGAVIEGASGLSYLDFMQEAIWEPLNMNFTYGEVADSTMANLSKFYFYTEEEATPYDLSYSYPTGGLISTAENLVTFGLALSQGNLLEESLLTQIFKSQSTNDGKQTGYGLGWYIGKDFNGKKVWYHAGESPSSGSMLLIYPEEKLAIAFLANSPILTGDDEGFSEEVQQLGEVIYKHKGW